MILVATPTRNTVNAGFAYDLANLIGWTPQAVFSIAQGSILPNLRGLLVKTAIENSATHILFIDSDMRFPPDTIHNLMKRNVDIIGANCKQRVVNEWTARVGDKFIGSEGKNGIEEVDTIGMGVTLINTGVFKKLDKPYFSMPWDTNAEKHVGEDVYFCVRAKEAGFKIFIDHDVSQKVRHAGIVEFGLE